MPYWKPDPIWQDQEVFIIGGGSSLDKFDWELLRPEWTIGCNDAYLHGSDICNICFFGDVDWWKRHHRQLESYRSPEKGSVFTHCNHLKKDKTSWLWKMNREPQGLHRNSLGWNKNTGTGAINLALILGAKRVFLLGFDMHLSNDGRSNWHTNNINKPNEKVYPKFLKSFKYVLRDLPIKFPGREIINVTDDSNLDCFPKRGVKEFWSNRPFSRNMLVVGV